MKAYLVTTGVLSGLLAAVHLWRAVEEGTHVLSDPFYLVSTLVALVMCAWAWALVRRVGRAA